MSGKIRYAGQPVGLLVARTKYAAFEARSSVIVTYDNERKPIVDIRDAVKAGVHCKDVHDDDINLSVPCRGLDTETTKKLLMNIKKTAKDRKTDTNVNSKTDNVKDGLLKVKGELYTDRQYHFHMETQICICVPRENGMDVYSATQHMNGVQAVIAEVLKVPCNRLLKNFLNNI